MSLVCYFLSVAFAFAAANSVGVQPVVSCNEPEGHIPILYKPDSNELPDTPRIPSFNPFFAYEDGSSVTLGSVSPYGDVAVTLVSTAGDYYQTVFDTEDGQVIIPISGDAGHYSLTLVTERGLVFEGEFDL